MSKAIIYIEESNSMADVTFPSVPLVMSLLHYDDADKTRDSLPIAGYPVVCVTVRSVAEATSEFRHYTFSFSHLCFC